MGSPGIGRVKAELRGVMGKDPAVWMDRAGHILEKSFQENWNLLDMTG